MQNTCFEFFALIAEFKFRYSKANIFVSSATSKYKHTIISNQSMKK